MIVDDHSGARHLIRRVIARSDDTVIECGSADEALGTIAAFQPNCVTMDVQMPGQNAFAAIRVIREEHPGVRVVVVTGFDQPDFRRAANDAGAAGYIAKDNLAGLYLLIAPQRLTSRQPARAQLADMIETNPEMTKP
jgi:DNA-binding NarL/FixJ family response regulator